jgi:hypothetical protein
MLLNLRKTTMPTAVFSAQGFTALLKTAAFIITLCIAAGASSAAHAWEWNIGFGKSVSGSGTIKSETRAVSGFTGISLSVNGLVEIQQGGAEGVTVETDDNLLPLLETVVENGTLKIRPATRNTSFRTRKIKFIVYAKTIDSLDIAGAGDIRAEVLKVSALKTSIAGSGDIRIKALDADALTVSIAGSGDFAAGGRAASMDASIAGSGDIKAGNMESKAVEISIAGSGDATVWARETLKVSVAGSGDVKYYGDSQVKKSIGGSGSVKRLGAAPSGA